MPIDLDCAAQDHCRSGIDDSESKSTPNKRVGEHRLVIVQDGSDGGRNQDDQGVARPECNQHGEGQAGGRVPRADPRPNLKIHGRAIEQYVHCDKTQTDQNASKPPSLVRSQSGLRPAYRAGLRERGLRGILHPYKCAIAKRPLQRCSELKMCSKNTPFALALARTPAIRQIAAVLRCEQGCASLWHGGVNLLL